MLALDTLKKKKICCFFKDIFKPFLYIFLRVNKSKIKIVIKLLILSQLFF